MRFPRVLVSVRSVVAVAFSALLVGAAACNSNGQVTSDAETENGTEASVPEGPTVDISKMTNGGEVLMPEATRRRLIAEDPLWDEALRIHYNAIVMDGHIDTPSLMLDHGYDFTARHSRDAAHVDLPRMFDGGLDAPFFAIYVGGGYGEGPEATRRALNMIDVVERQVAAAPDRVEMAYTAEDVRRITREGRKAILMGLEGGHALQGSKEVLRQLYDRGIRYVTLTHTNTNSWADASQSPPRWNGLNDLGRDLVREMNRIGMLVDLSHVSDETFYDAIEVSEAPVILSHSSARALTDNVRNIDDAMLRRLKENGGVIMINFFDSVVNRHLTDDVMADVYRRVREIHGGNLRMIWQEIYNVRRERGLPRGDVEDIIDHADHIVQTIGVDHVALGSDFDGVSALPQGMEDVTRLPWITYHLLKRGYAEEEVYKILGGNTLRAIEEAERVSREWTGDPAN